MIDTTLDQEIQNCINKGIPVEEDHQYIDLHALTSSIRHSLHFIGQAKLGQDKTSANCLQDIGSTGTFVSHRCARRLKQKKLKVITLTVCSMTVPVQVKTFVYECLKFNFIKKDFDLIKATGVESIGSCHAPTIQTRWDLDKVLKYAKLDTYDLTWVQMVRLTCSWGVTMPASWSQTTKS